MIIFLDVYFKIIWNQYVLILENFERNGKNNVYSIAYLSNKQQYGSLLNKYKF